MTMTAKVGTIGSLHQASSSKPTDYTKRFTGQLFKNNYSPEEKSESHGLKDQGVPQSTSNVLVSVTDADRIDADHRDNVRGQRTSSIDNSNVAGERHSSSPKGRPAYEGDGADYFSGRLRNGPATVSSSSASPSRPIITHSASTPEATSSQLPLDAASKNVIPPPCEARKHRPSVPSSSSSSQGGVLLSTVRTRGAGGPSTMSTSKSVDDLGYSGRETKGGWKRSRSIPMKGANQDERDEMEDLINPSDDFGMSLDNSARFYHHHPYSQSASTSPTRHSSLLLPDSSLPSAFGPIGSLLARRNFTMPANTANQNMDLDIGDRSIPMRGSPSLSPTAMLKGTDVNANGRLVILTPTTQEWRELGFEHLRDLGGEGVEGESDSERERKRSLSSTDSEGMEDFGWNVVPKLSRTHSADVLGAVDESERSRSIPGCNVLGIANDGHEESVILTVPPPTSGTTTLARGLRGTSSRASSRRSSIPEEPRSAPPLLEEGDLFAKLIGMQLEEAERQKEAVGSEPISRKTSPQPPQNSTSPGIGIPIGEPSMTIGRSQSMRETGEGPKRKERERERLFRLVGEEVEKNGIQKPARGWGIKQIGNGGGLAALSPASPTQSEPSPTETLGLRPALFEGRSISSPGDLVDIPKPTIGLQGDRKPKSTLPKKLSSSVSQIGGLSMTSVKPTAAPSPLHASTVPPPESFSEPNSNPASRSGTRIHSRSPTYSANHPSNSPPAIVRPVSPITSRRRQSQRLSSLAGRTPQPFAFPAALPPSHPMNRKPNSNLLSAFSPFTTTGSSKPAAARPEMSREPSAHPLLSVPHYLQPGDRSDSMISIAPSTRAPSEPGTPLGETVGGMGGHGIDDYVIISEAGKGAYGLVKRARQRGWDGEPMGDEVIIKYIIKSRILADCWKKHKILGPIPIEIHVMDQLRNVPHKRPPRPFPWDPLRSDLPVTKQEIDYFTTPPMTETPTSQTGSITPVAFTNPPSGSAMDIPPPDTMPQTAEDSELASLTAGDVDPMEWHARISAETVKNRGHPNVCKMLDFFEDREFYYLVMPRFGAGLDLFDRVESAPDGLPPFEIRSLLGQLSDALRFLHANGIVHRDIKDENVILDGQGHCQLIDFGSAAHWRPGRKWDTFSGTLDYASPEILRGEMYSGKEQDVWALGVVGYVLICGETPFLSADEAQAGLGEGTKPYVALMQRCSGKRGEEGLESDGGGRMKHAYDFVQRCLEMKPEDRPPADALVKHRFVLGNGGWVGHRQWIVDGKN